MESKSTKLLILKLSVVVACCFIICHLTKCRELGQFHGMPLAEKYIPFTIKETPFETHQVCQLRVNGSQSIEHLYDIIQQWKHSPISSCRELYDSFSRIFDIDKAHGEILLPDTFRKKLKNVYHLSDSMITSLHHQAIIKVLNRITFDSNMLNPIRDKRPAVDTSANERKYVQKVVDESKAACDFCNYSKYTAFDVFGRIESPHAFTAANAFKYDGWHSLLIFRGHHPLNWSKEVFLDGLSIAMKWFSKVYSAGPDYIYPVICWDLMPHASASQIHPHIHLSVTRRTYYGDIERWRQANLDYQSNTGRNYFSDLLDIHHSLGLAVFHGSAAAFATITPKRDYEIVILSDSPNHDFFTLVYYVIRNYIDKMKKYCFSLVMALPEMTGEGEFGKSMPAFVRVVPRGSVSDIKSDVSSLVLFAGPEVHSDPYKAIRLLKELIKQRK